MRSHLLGPALVLALVPACVPADRSVADGAPGKRELFADAGLVPTREGERARRELALAGELERLLARASVAASVSVSLVEPPSAVVVASSGEIDRIRPIARAALPGIADQHIHVTIAELDEADDDPLPNRTLPLLASTLALGLTLGIALERARQRFALA